jgi:hypothetical protein
LGQNFAFTFLSGMGSLAFGPPSKILIFGGQPQPSVPFPFEVFEQRLGRRCDSFIANALAGLNYTRLFNSSAPLSNMRRFGLSLCDLHINFIKGIDDDYLTTSELSI